MARYDDHGASYVRTVRVERGTPSVWGLFQDKINVAVDQSLGTETAGNVYVAWARYPGQAANNVVFFTRSSDGGRTFSKPQRLTQGRAEEQFADIAVGPQTLAPWYGAPVLPLRGMPREAARVQRSRNTFPPFSSIAMIRSVTDCRTSIGPRPRGAEPRAWTTPALGESSGGTGGTPVAVGLLGLR